jgi:formate C-acetyltransferase
LQIICIEYKIADSIDDISLKQSKAHFESMIVSKITTVEDALQRILFWSSLFWRSQHLLVGIGRLDKLLEGLCFEDENHNFLFL